MLVPRKNTVSTKKNTVSTKEDEVDYCYYQGRRRKTIMIISATVLLAIQIGVTVDIAERRMNTAYDKNHLRNERDIIIWTKGEKSNLRRQKFR